MANKKSMMDYMKSRVSSQPKPSGKKAPSRGMVDIFDVRDRGTSNLEKGMTKTRKKIEKKVTPIFDSKLGSKPKKK